MSNRKSKIQNRKSREGFTLVEVMIAAALSLVVIAAVVQILATVGNTAADTRAVVQMTDRLRSARIVIQQDLSNTTAEMLPPQRSDRSAGYFEYIEGPDGPIFPGLGASPLPVAFDINQSAATGSPVSDSTVGDPDDMLMFTANAPNGTFFYGRIRTATQVIDGSGRTWYVPVDTMAQSPTAEICLYMRGDTLYRRVLLVNPDAGIGGTIDPTIFLWSQYPNYVSAATQMIPQPTWDIAFYDKFDLSARQTGGSFDISNSLGGAQPPVLKANSLADLTFRQNRYGHQPWVYPFDARFWDVRFWTTPSTNVPGGFLGLPTLRECSAYTGATSGPNGVARWPFPLFEFNPNSPIALAPLALSVVGGGTANIPVSGDATVASSNLWGQTVYFAAGTNPAWVQPPVFPYYNPSAVAPAPPGLPLIYPMPSSGNVPAGTSVANFQPVTTVPQGTWTARMNLTNANGGLFDLWANPYPLDQQDETASPRTGSIYAFSSAYQPSTAVNVNFSTRYADDVLLTHVLSFDVKAWDPTAPTLQTDTTFGGAPPGTYVPGDPGYVQIINAWAAAGLTTLQTYLQPKQTSPTQPTGQFGGYGYVVAQGAYVDLNYLGPVIQQYLTATPPTMAQALAGVSNFAGPGVSQFGSTWSTGSGLAMVYDTGCFDYEHDGIDQNQNGIIDDFTNGLDDNGIGGVDDLTEVEGPTPYPVPLKGIQIRIRVFDPDSRQIREVTVTEDFLYD